MALVTIFGVLLSLPLAAQEVSVGWHDHMYLQPGDGVQLNRQHEPRFPGLVAMSSTGTTTGAGGTKTTFTFAQHTYDMIKTLNVNSSASLNYLAFSGNVDVSFFGRQTFDANDLIFVVTTTRDFGTTKFTPLYYSSSFSNQVARYEQNLQGEALYSAITSTFGTHFVRGYQSQAMVSLVYSFHYASSSVKQRLTVSSSGSYGSDTFSSFVSSFLSYTNTAVSMSYRFYSSDPFLVATNFGFATAGIIRNSQEYSNLVTQVQSYANSMSQTNAKISGYILDELWQAPFAPDLLAQLGGYTPTDHTDPTPNDNHFLQAYSALQAWKQGLDPWILDGKALSWLNDQGRQLVQAGWLKAGNYLSAMKAIAVSHFTTGTPLNVPSDVTAYLANLSNIKLPEINLMGNFNFTSGSDRYLFGRIDCGCRNLTIPIPFNSVSELYYETNNGTLATIYYNPVDFEDAQLNAYPSGTVHTKLQNLFTGPDWACYTNNPNLNGFFLVSQKTSESPNWSLAISSGTDANGNAIVVDEMGFLDTRSGGCTTNDSCLETITNLVSASTAVVPAFGNEVISSIEPGSLQVGYQASVQAHGSETVEPVFAQNPKASQKPRR